MPRRDGWWSQEIHAEPPSLLPYAVASSSHIGGLISRDEKELRLAVISAFCLPMLRQRAMCCYWKNGTNHDQTGEFLLRAGH